MQVSVILRLLPLFLSIFILPTSGTADLHSRFDQLQSAQIRQESVIEALKSQVSRQSAQLNRLADENVDLRTEVAQLRVAVETLANSSGYSTTAVDAVLDSIQRRLMDMKSDVTVLTSRERSASVSSRHQSTRAIRQLQSGLNSVKRDVQVIQLMEDQNIPDLKASLAGQDVQLRQLLQVTDNLSAQLSDIRHGDDTIVYSQSELDQLRSELRKLNGSYEALEQRNFALSDEHKWNSFLIETVKVDLEELREEFRSADTRLADQMSQMVDRLLEINETTSKSLPLRLAPELDFDNSGDGPELHRPDKFQQLQKEIIKATDCCAKSTLSLEKLNRKVQLCGEEVENLRSVQKSSLRDLQEVKSAAATRESLASVIKDLQELRGWPKAVDKLKMAADSESKSLRDSLAQTEMMARKAEKIATVVQNVQTDHFGVIQNFAQDLNEVRTDVLRFGLKLTTLQAEFLNSSLHLYKQTNTDLQQDVSLRDLKLQLKQTEDHYNELYQEFKTISGTNLLVSLPPFCLPLICLIYFVGAVRAKVGRAELKQLQEELANVNGKFENQTGLTSWLEVEVNQLTSAVDRLESQLPSDCSSISGGSGVYLIKPVGSGRSVKIFCEAEADGGRWAVIQRRIGPEVNFNRSWDEYAEGFGQPNGSHWLGNEIVHLMTSRQPYQLQVDLVDIFDRYWLASYNRFSVGSRHDGYLLAVGGASGNASDALAYHDQMRFSAADKDSDASSTDCAKYYASGWWFSHCHKANPNGNFQVGMIWFNSNTKDWLQLSRVTMKIRPAQHLHDHL